MYDSLLLGFIQDKEAEMMSQSSKAGVTESKEGIHDLEGVNLKTIHNYLELNYYFHAGQPLPSRLSTEALIYINLEF